MISVADGAVPTGATLGLPALRSFLRRACEAVGLAGEVEVLLSSDAELRRLNRRFRGKNKATDVLSFPAEPMLGMPAAGQHAGDLAISLETAARQAEEHGHSLATEVRVLLLHGILHLAGMDHETDGGEMRDREAELRRTLRLPTSLIARSLVPPERDHTGPAPGKASRPAAAQKGAAATLKGKRGSRP